MVLKCVLKYLKTDNVLSNHVCYVGNQIVQYTVNVNPKQITFVGKYVTYMQLFLVYSRRNFLSIIDEKTNVTHSSYIGLV